MASTEPVANNNKKIFFIIGGLILLIVIIILIVKPSKKSQDAEDIKAQMLLLQQEHQDPNTSSTQKDTIANKIANLAVLLAQIKAGKTGTPPLVPGSTIASWTPIPSSSGVCKNPASLNKELLLKSGSINGEVCALQSYLNSQNNAGLVNDGNFGPKTGAALLAATGKNQITLKELIG